MHDTLDGALTPIQIHNLTQSGWIEWHPTKCDEELEGPQHMHKTRTSLENPDLFLPSPASTELNPNGTQCGYYTYGPEALQADPATFKPTLEKELTNWIQHYNQKISTVEAGHLDPIDFAAWVQKSFVTLHPFSDGNGRVSRLLMDCILLTVGLPAPILANMNQDLFTSEAEWAHQVRNGIVTSTNIFKKCAENPYTLSCLSTVDIVRKRQEQEMQKEVKLKKKKTQLPRIKKDSKETEEEPLDISGFFDQSE